MSHPLTPEWITSLRRDVAAWDNYVKYGRLGLQPWPELIPPLKYTTDEPDKVNTCRHTWLRV